jgi:SAM-dependent methyltransferase
MERSDYTRANRKAWNQAAPIHERLRFEDLLAGFRTPGYTCLDPVETAVLRKIGLEGKSVAQLLCNNGRELLSIRNLGAGRCVGFDIADAFLEQAHRLAEAGNIDCAFVAGDVYEIPDEFDGAFDLVYVTIGALCWLPDLPAFFARAKRLLRPRGHIFLYEMHPFLDMLDPEDPRDPLRIRYSYFMTGAVEDLSGLDYYGGTQYASEPKYWFHHRLADVLGGLLREGFALVDFAEYPHDISNLFGRLEGVEAQPPLCYTLVARLGG